MKRFLSIAPAFALAMSAAPAAAQPSYSLNGPHVASAGSPPRAYPNFGAWDVSHQRLFAPWRAERASDPYRHREDATLSEAQRSLSQLLDRNAFAAAAPAARALVEAGDGWAARQLGWMYLRGLGVPRNPHRALELLGESATQGDGPSALALARIYQGGLGVPRDATLTNYWIDRAQNDAAPEIRRAANRLRRGR